MVESESNAPSLTRMSMKRIDCLDSRDRSAMTNEGELGSDADRAHMGPVKPKGTLATISIMNRKHTQMRSFALGPNRQPPDLSINDITEVRRLEYLCRCHVLLAFTTRRNKPDYKTLLEKAYWFLMRLWQVETVSEDVN